MPGIRDETEVWSQVMRAASACNRLALLLSSARLPNPVPGRDRGGVSVLYGGKPVFAGLAARVTKLP